MARSLNVYTSLPTLRVWHHFTRKQRIYGDFKVAGNNKTYWRILSDLFCPILTKTGFSQQIFTKVQSIKFHENLSGSNSADTCGRTDRHDTASRCFCGYTRAPTDYCKSSCMWKQPILTEYQAATILAVDWIFKPIISKHKPKTLLLKATTSMHIGTANPLQAWTAPECSRRLRLPDFKTIGTWRW